MTDMDGRKDRRSLPDILQKIVNCDGPGSNKYEDYDNRRLRKKILSILFACHIAAFVQALGYNIQHTAFPYLTKQLGVTPQVYGYINSFTAMLQLSGGIFCGRLSDIYGGRFTLIISFMTIGVAYLILAVSTNTFMLFISRIPTFTSHAIQSMYVIIADITCEEQRADMLGKLGVSHGLGMIAGCTLGGLITDKFGIRPTFIVAVVFMTVCICTTTTLIPADTKSIRLQLHDTIVDDIETKSITPLQNDPAKSKRNESSEKGKADEKNPGSFVDIKKYIELAKTKHFLYLLTVKFIASFPVGVLHSMSSLLLIDSFNLVAKQTGIVLSYIGFVSMVSHGYIVGFLARHCKDNNLILLSSVLLGIGFLFLIISESVYIYCVVQIPLTVGGSLLIIIITSLITKIVPKEQRGSALGLIFCTHSIIRTVASTVSGYLFQHIGLFSFGILGYVINSVLSVYLAFFGKKSI